VARRYHTVNHKSVSSEKQLADFLIRNGQQLLPLVELIEQSRIAVEELIDCVGRVTIQAVLMASAEQVAGPPTRNSQGSGDSVVWQAGRQGVSARRQAGDRAATAASPRTGRRQRSGPSKKALLRGLQDATLIRYPKLQSRVSFFDNSRSLSRCRGMRSLGLQGSSLDATQYAH